MNPKRVQENKMYFNERFNKIFPAFQKKKYPAVHRRTHLEKNQSFWAIVRHGR